MSFVKTAKFKYFKNLIIGVGAAIVLMGALFKLESFPYASEMLIIGLSIEAFIFLFLGLVGPEPDFYWNKLYPGLEDYNSNIAPLTAGGPAQKQLDNQKIEGAISGILGELQSMSKSLGSLKALQEVDFSGAKEQLGAMNNFYKQMTESMANLSATIDDTKKYKENLTNLNHNLGSLNNVYGGMLNAIANISHSPRS